MRKPITSSGRLKAGAVVKMYKKVEADYAYNADVFSEDDTRTAAVKRAISELPASDRTIMILYTELQSYSELGKVLNCCKATAFQYVKRIRQDILKKIKNAA